jgi:hypothetical protein
VPYRVIAEHLEAFLDTAKCQADGSPLPGWRTVVSVGRALKMTSSGA